MSESVFDFCQPKRNPQQRAKSYTFENTWKYSSSRINGLTLENRKSQAISEIKRRILLLMGDKLLGKIGYICVVMNWKTLVYKVDEFKIPLRCYLQGLKDISTSSLQERFKKEADWKPIFGGLYNCSEFRDENIQRPWEKIVIHGELRKSNAQKKEVSSFASENK